jgi:hypothetical protein
VAVHLVLSDDEARAVSTSCVTIAKRLAGNEHYAAEAQTLAGFGLELAKLAEASTGPVTLHAVV